MNIAKKIAGYFIWVLIAFVCAYVYISIIIGSEPETSESLLDFFSLLIYRLIILKVVPIIGSIIALLFILMDVFFLKKHLKNTMKGVGIRLLVILLITCAVGSIHYILEKVIDII